MRRQSTNEGRCSCRLGFRGNDCAGQCALECDGGAENPCSGNGMCGPNASCACRLSPAALHGYRDAHTSNPLLPLAAAPPADSAARRASPGWIGRACTLPCPSGPMGPCSSHGACVESNGAARCECLVSKFSQTRAPSSTPARPSVDGSAAPARRAVRSSKAQGLEDDGSGGAGGPARASRRRRCRIPRGSGARPARWTGRASPQRPGPGRRGSSRRPSPRCRWPGPGWACSASGGSSATPPSAPCPPASPPSPRRPPPPAAAGPRWPPARTAGSAAGAAAGPGSLRIRGGARARAAAPHGAARRACTARLAADSYTAGPVGRAAGTDGCGPGGMPVGGMTVPRSKRGAAVRPRPGARTAIACCGCCVRRRVDSDRLCVGGATRGAA
jgi:hypothetical protein